MPKWSSEGLSVVAFLGFKPACWLLVIYYIKQGLSKQKVLAMQSLHRLFQCLHRVYTEQYRSTQSLHRTIYCLHRVYTEQSKSTQSLHRLIQWLHRVYTEQYIYTESTQNSAGVYTESTQNNADLHRVYTEQNGVYTESTQSYAYVHSWTYYTTLLIFRKSSIVLTVFPLKFKYK